MASHPPFLRLLLAAFSLFFSPGLFAQNTPTLGIERTAEYLPDLAGKRVALVVNHTSIFPNYTHLADSLLRLGVTVSAIFAPEHGFRGTAADGEQIVNGVDVRTGVPIVSLYGANRKPTPAQLSGIDVVIFDIQDVGARFYTYTSTLHYVLEACAELGKHCLILDRPNPNGHYVDGPVLDRRFASFVGLNPVALVHGCTVGELAQMIVGERWISPKTPAAQPLATADSLALGASLAAQPDSFRLKIVTCLGYTHQTPYAPLVATSPNLPNLQSVLLYPSICLFEPTRVSVGRGTDTQFQVLGATDSVFGGYTFTPVERPGAHKPPNENQLCYGLDLRSEDARADRFTLKYLFYFWEKNPDKTRFFTSPAYFDKLAGTDALRHQLEAGRSERVIRRSWRRGLRKYNQVRAKYLLYPETALEAEKTVAQAPDSTR